VNEPYDAWMRLLQSSAAPASGQDPSHVGFWGVIVPEDGTLETQHPTPDAGVVILCAAGRLAPMFRRPQLRSTLARAVVPVLGGIGFFVVIGLALWGVAAIASRDNEQATDRLAPPVQDIGRTDTFAASIADDGPIVLNDLVGDDRRIVLDHTGADDRNGWAIYLAHPADRTAECAIELIRNTRTFTDCEGRTIRVDDLALPPRGVQPIVSADGLLSLDLRADTAAPGTTAD